MITNCDLFGLPSIHSKDVICEIAEEAKLNNIKIVVVPNSKGDNFLGDIFRIRISGMRESGNESIYLVLKVAPSSVDFRKNIPVKMFYEQEIFAYTRMLPVLDSIQEVCDLPYEKRFHFAKLYKSIGVNTKEMLIFEDLSNKGFQMYNRLQPFDYEHLSFTIKYLARYHATSFVLKAKDPQLFDEMASKISTTMDYGVGFINLMKKSAARAMFFIDDPEVLGKLKKYFANMLEDITRVLDMKNTAPYNVLCHGDFWSNNMLFQYKDGKVSDMRLLDWQIIRCGSPIIDIAYLIFTSMDEDSRTKYYHHILELYYDTLSCSVSAMGFDICNIYPKRVFEEQIESIMIYGFSMSITTLSLILANKEAPPDIESLMGNDVNCDGKDVVFSDKSIERIKGVIKFFVEEKFI